MAAKSRLPPIDVNDPNRCTVAALDKFADTRAAFSQESSGGNMVEAIVSGGQSGVLEASGAIGGSGVLGPAGFLVCYSFMM